MHLIVQLGLGGIGSAAALALLAVGLVVTFRGSGVINFAHGAVATATVYVYLELYDHGWPLYAAMTAGLLAAIAIAVGFYYFVMRRLTYSSVLAKVVATLGLMIAIQGAVSSWFPNNPLAPILIQPTTVTLPSGSPNFTIGQDRLWIFLIALIVTGAMWALFRWTRFGLTTQAAADNDRAVSLVGTSPQLISLANWVTGAILAGGAGILLTTLVPIDPTFFTLALVTAIAAALVGGFNSFWLTFAGALVIGIAQPILTYYTPKLSQYTGLTGWSDALPFLIIAVMVIARGRAIPLRDTVRQITLPPARRPPHPLIMSAAALLAGLIWFLLLPASWAEPMAITMIGALLCLSVVVITGYVGQISLAQLGFAGFSAFTTAIFASDCGIGFPWSIVLGALTAVPVGVLLGLPALRVRGVQLAVITLGGALVLQDMVFNGSTLSGGDLGRTVSAAHIGSVSINGVTQPRSFGILCLIVFLLACLGVVALRRSSLGQRFLAVRNNERGAGAAGISLMHIKLTAFAISSFIAGLAGGLMTYNSLQITGVTFDAQTSILITAIAYIGGVASLAGAFIGGLFFSGGVLSYIGSLIWSSDWSQAIAGLSLLLVVANHPDGLAGVPDQVRTALRRRRRQAAGTSPEPDAGSRGHDPADTSAVPGPMP